MLGVESTLARSAAAQLSDLVGAQSVLSKAMAASVMPRIPDMLGAESALSRAMGAAVMPPVWDMLGVESTLARSAAAQLSDLVGAQSALSKAMAASVMPRIPDMLGAESALSKIVMAAGSSFTVDSFLDDHRSEGPRRRLVASEVWRPVTSDDVVAAIVSLIFVLSIVRIYIDEANRIGQSLTELNRVDLVLALIGIWPAANSTRKAVLWLAAYLKSS